MGEKRGVRAGTLGRVPLESVRGEVQAAPNHDTFAVAADLCFILAHPTLKNEDVNMWTHSVRVVGKSSCMLTYDRVEVCNGVSTF